MKKYNEMGRSEFLAEVNDYINTLEEPIQRNEADPLTEEEWIDWIKKEAAEKGEEFTDENIGWIIERLADDGVVSGKMWYACMVDREDSDFGTGSYSLDKAIEWVKDRKDVYPDAYIAVVEMGNDPICVDEIEVE